MKVDPKIIQDTGALTQAKSQVASVGAAGGSALGSMEQAATQILGENMFSLASSLSQEQLQVLHYLIQNYSGASIFDRVDELLRLFSALQDAVSINFTEADKDLTQMLKKVQEQLSTVKESLVIKENLQSLNRPAIQKGFEIYKDMETLKNNLALIAKNLTDQPNAGGLRTQVTGLLEQLHTLRLSNQEITAQAALGAGSLGSAGSAGVTLPERVDALIRVLANMQQTMPAEAGGLDQLFKTVQGQLSALKENLTIKDVSTQAAQQGFQIHKNIETLKTSLVLTLEGLSSQTAGQIEGLRNQIKELISQIETLEFSGPQLLAQAALGARSLGSAGSASSAGVSLFDRLDALIRVLTNMRQTMPASEEGLAQLFKTVQEQLSAVKENLVVKDVSAQAVRKGFEVFKDIEVLKNDLILTLDRLSSQPKTEGLRARIEEFVNHLETIKLFNHEGLKTTTNDVLLYFPLSVKSSGEHNKKVDIWVKPQFQQDGTLDEGKVSFAMSIESKVLGELMFHCEVDGKNFSCNARTQYEQTEKLMRDNTEALAQRLQNLKFELKGFTCRAVSGEKSGRGVVSNIEMTI